MKQQNEEEKSKMTQKMAIVGFGGQGKLFLNAASKLLTDSLEVIAICDINSKVFEVEIGKEKESWVFEVEIGKEKESWQTVYQNLTKVKPLQGEIYQDFMVMLDQVKPDILVVATWTKYHAVIVEEAAEKGVKKIICEIPLASSLKEGRRMIDACRENGVLLAVNHTRRWLLDHQEIRRLIREEKVIGDLRHIWISCGGVRLSDLGTHWIDWARWITGEKVVKVFSKLDLDKDIAENPRGKQFIDPPGEIFMIFENGATAFIHEGGGVALPPRYEVIGTKGRILGEQLPPKMMSFWKIDVRKDATPDPVKGYYGEMERVPFTYDEPIMMDIEAATAASLRELLEGKTSCDGEEGYATLEVLIAAHFTNNSFIRLPLDVAAIEWQLHLQSA